MLGINNKAWEKLRTTDIIKHLSGGEENTFFEYKEEDTTPTDFVKEVSAFANTYGGYIFLGVKDDGTILGCKKWTEERITNSIYNNLTPTPNFDVKKFIIQGKRIYVVKIEAGCMPPYITNKGAIYERVSSSSCKIDKSEKLSQLFDKSESQQKKTANRIELPPLSLDKNIPQNLCAYLDFGFEVVNSQSTVLERNWANFDFTPISEYLRKNCIAFSISRVGASFNISIGTIKSDGQPIHFVSGLHNFIEIMQDGSVRGRIILCYDASDKVNIGDILTCHNHYYEIYKLIFGQTFYKSFIYALHYEKLTVVKQFTTYYSAFNEDEKLKFYLTQHKERYGNNLVINGNRIPSNGYFVIDRRYLEGKGIKFNNDNLIFNLFCSYYINLGYIDPPKN